MLNVKKLLTKILEILLTKGDIVTVNGTDGNINSGADTSLCNTYLDPGLYFVEGTARFASNGTGDREIHLSTNNNGAAINKFYSSGSQRVSGTSYYGVRLSCMLKVTTRTRYYLVGYQTSGSALAVTQRGMMITKIL